MDGDSIVAIVLLIFESDGFLHQICSGQSDANIRIPLYVVSTIGIGWGVENQIAKGSIYLLLYYTM